MTSHSHDATANRRPVLDSTEIHEVLSMTLIANSDTLDNDWVSTSYSCSSCGLVTTSAFRPIATHTHKYRNLRARLRASVMIDVSRAGLNLKAVLIRDRVKLVEGEDEARRINCLIHLKYVTSEVLRDASVACYLLEDDNITVKEHMDHVISWNLDNSKAGKALRVGGWFRPFDG